MDFKAAISFCEQKIGHKLYAMNIVDAEQLAIYTLQKLDLSEENGSHVMFTEVEGEIFDIMAYENDYDLDVAAKLSSGLVFFCGEEMQSSDEDFPSFLVEKFPSLLKHSQNEKSFVKHAIHCIQAFNLGAVQIAQGIAVGERETVH
jgi:hypothetical protein